MNEALRGSSQKISMADLQRLMRDPEYPDSELKYFFTAYPDASRPFSPAIVPDPQRVDITAPADELEGAVMMDWANDLSRQRRQAKFRLRRGLGDLSPVLVSEGDSWFQFPLLLEDVVDQLSSDFNIWSVDAAGDTLQNMVIDQQEYLNALREQAGLVKAFLFSGGGNDFLGEEGGRSILTKIVKSFKPGKPPEWYIETDAFAEKLRFVEQCYDKVIASVAKEFPGLPVICHGYDYSIPGGAQGDPRHPIYAAQDQWIGKPLRSIGINDRDLQIAIVKLLIDKFNERLDSLCGGAGGGTYKDAWYVNARGTVGSINRWADELHPTDDGFALVAAKFRAVISKAAPGIVIEREAVAVPTTAGFVCEGSGEFENEFESAASKPHVDRIEQTDHKSSRDGAKIDHIVIHYTTSRNIEGSISHFKSGTPRTSAHYIVGRDGLLVQMVPDSERAWHAGTSAMNARSIGIEHVAAPGDAIAPAQAKTSLALIRWLMIEYGIPTTNVIPHVCVKSTSCCGDLFKEFGGGAGKSCGVQRAALQKWLKASGLGGTGAESAAFETLETEPEGRRLEMAKLIVNYEARRDGAGRLSVYRLPAGDGGGRYEVAGINEKFHRTLCDELVRLIESGKHAEAEQKAREFIAQYTDRAADWCQNGATEFYLRDCIFNRGAGGAARILQRAVDVRVDGDVGAQTRAAVAAAEADINRLLTSLRRAREWYERAYAHRDESSKFWRGLVNRWDKAKSDAVRFRGRQEDSVASASESHASMPLAGPSPQPAPVGIPRMELASDLTLILVRTWNS